MFTQRKAMEMSVGLLVGIVIALVLLAILLYVILGMGKQSSAVSKCETMGGKCSLNCPPAEQLTYTRGSLTPCKIGDSKVYDGRCCFPEIEG